MVFSQLRICCLLNEQQHWSKAQSFMVPIDWNGNHYWFRFNSVNQLSEPATIVKPRLTAAPENSPGSFDETNPLNTEPSQYFWHCINGNKRSSSIFWIIIFSLSITRVTTIRNVYSTNVFQFTSSVPRLSDFFQLPSLIKVSPIGNHSSCLFVFVSVFRFWLVYTKKLLPSLGFITLFRSSLIKICKSCTLQFV